SVFPLVVLVKMPVFYFLDLYRGMWRYTSTLDVLNIIKASSLATLILTVFVLFVHNFGGFSRSVFIIDWGITIIFLSGFRLCVRFYYDNRSNSSVKNRKGLTNLVKELFVKKKGVKKLLIIGAGNCGQKIAKEVMNNAGLKYDVVGFLDDYTEKVGKKIHGIPVLNFIENLSNVAAKVGAQEILIAVPSAESAQMRRIIEICRESGLEFKIVPDMAELINGNVTVHASRNISFRDLLGREPVKLDQKKVGGYIKGQTVIVTGAGGSIGSELCRQICRFNPKQLILFDNAETPLYQIDLELKRYFIRVDIVPVLGDIQNRNEL
ncbi:MAG: polysaccharide biosynthesis protein, partial [Thermodesulfobacteriota bacterium]|nr:polysaccharide biosynthesis protein [Thermodesulfobacteriota bacterium]